MKMNFLDGTFIIYKLGCFVGTFYIIYMLFDQYYLNDDASKVLIKRFAEAGRSSFPAITLCLSDDGSNSLYDEEYVSFNAAVDAKDYRDALMGKETRINESFLQDPEFFRKATIKMENYLLKFKIYDVNEENIVYWKELKKTNGITNETEKFPLLMYYQDPNLLCYSYHAHYSENITVDSINYYFNLSKLQTITGGEIYIFVHYTNHLVRNMRYVYKIRSLKGISHHNSNNALVLDMRYISIMRSRRDARDPCDETLINDDKAWMKNVMSVIGCYPCYWENIFLDNTDSVKCKTNEELKIASMYHPRNNERMTKHILKMYTQPCDQMRVSVNSNSDQHDNSEIFKIKFRFR